MVEILLTDALNFSDPDDLTAEEIAEIRVGLRHGMQAVLEWRERPVGEYGAEAQRRRAARQAEPSKARV